MMVMHVLGDATPQETLSAITPRNLEHHSTKDFEKRSDESLAASWALCWRGVSLKDLYGYPLWETQLHDLLRRGDGTIADVTRQVGRCTLTAL